jgi:serine/threonine-protein kinase
VGAVGYYLLTGRHVFEGSSVVEVCGHHLHTEPVPPSQRTDRPIPPDLERLILDCLAKDPAARPQTARDLERRLEACVVAEPWTPDAAHAWWMARRAARPEAERPSKEGPELALTIEVQRTPDVSS